MNVWGWLFISPIIALLVIEPVETAALLIFLVVWIAAWLWIINKAIGKKD